MLERGRDCLLFSFLFFSLKCKHSLLSAVMLLGVNLFLQAVLHIWQKSLPHIKIQGGCTKFAHFNGVIQLPIADEEPLRTEETTQIRLFSSSFPVLKNGSMIELLSKCVSFASSITFSLRFFFFYLNF